MAASNAKEKLVDFLDRKAFEPVLKASPDAYESEGDRRKLEHVQRATRGERERYHEQYDSAEEVRDNFRDDLNSGPAKEVHRELRDLGLPTLNDVSDDFDRLCREVGVG